MIQIPGYRVIKELGEGGMASVYLAEQVSLERLVALKVMSAKLTDDPTFTTRFLREARIAARLAHPHIITVHEVGVHDNQHYICMEHHDGGDLKSRLRAGLSQDEALLIAREIISALAFAHDAGFIHRDVKPANVLFRGDGGAVLMDFGIAKATDAENKLTQVGSILGTPYYISPEQVSGRDPNARSDLYSAGVMLFEMLTGALPFQSETAAAIMYAHVAKPIPRLLPALAQFQALIDGLMAKDPDQRFQSGHEVVAELDALLPHRTGLRTGIRTTGPTAGGMHGRTTSGTRSAPSDRPIDTTHGGAASAPTALPVPETRRDYAGEDDGLTLTANRPAGAATTSGAATTAGAAITAAAATRTDAATMLAGASPPDVTLTESATITVAANPLPATALAESGTAARLDAASTEAPTLLGATTIESGHAPDRAPAPDRSAAPQPASARVIKGRFRLLNSLGKGGMGTVYRAVDLLKQEAGDKTPYVAVKLLNDNISKMQNALRIMQRETKNSQELSHPNIIKVFDFDRDDNDLYMTMELLEGKPLDSAIHDGDVLKLDLAARADIIEQMSAGLAYAHEKGVIHCDFKPGNVFLLADGQVKVLDFGIARFAQGVTESAGDTLFGYTPRYASAEIMQMLPAHPADDVYALACVAYEVLSGDHPFDGRNIVEAEREARAPAKLPDLKRHQWNALVRGLAFKKEERLQSAAEFLQEFHGRPNWLLYGAAAAVLAGVIGIGAWYGGLASSDPADAIAPELRAESVAKSTQAIADLTKFHSRALPFLYPKALQEFSEALKANPYNKPALGALAAEAKTLMATSPQTEADRQDLKSKLQGMLEIEAVPERAGLQSKLQTL